MKKLDCEKCPFWEPANGYCDFPGDCTLPEDNELLRIIATGDDSIEEARKEVRT